MEEYVLEFRNGSFFQNLAADHGGPKETAMRFPTKDAAWTYVSEHGWMALYGPMPVPIPSEPIEPIDKNTAHLIAFCGFLDDSDEKITETLSSTSKDPAPVLAAVHSMRERAARVVAAFDAVAVELEDFRLVVEADYACGGSSAPVGVGHAAELARSLIGKKRRKPKKTPES